jgi:hypothetical protein
MVQQSSSPHVSLSHEPYADSDHPVLPFPTRFVRYVPTDLLAQSAGRQPLRPRARQGLTFMGEASPWSLGSHARVGLPTADGGKVVWAVFEAPRLRPSTACLHRP